MAMAFPDWLVEVSWPTITALTSRALHNNASTAADLRHAAVVGVSSRNPSKQLEDLGSDGTLHLTQNHLCQSGNQPEANNSG